MPESRLVRRRALLPVLAAVLLVAASLAACLQPASADPLFALPVSFATGLNPTSVAVADFNADGRPDLAVANRGSKSVSVLLGDGKLGFTPHVRYATGDSPASVAVGDFNSDGRLDLAVANAGSKSVSVFLGNGNGTFQGARDVLAGSAPRSVAIGDFNADGKPDLVVANYDSGTVSVLLGNGNGTFGARQVYAAGNSPTCVAVGDFNADGRPDLAVSSASTEQVSVLLANADGTFAARSGYHSSGGYSESVAVVDFNADGKLDLVFLNNYEPIIPPLTTIERMVSVLFGNGDGTFGRTLDSVYSWGGSGRGVAVGDFNGDGAADVAVAAGADGAAVLLGRGNAGTCCGAAYVMPGSPVSVAVGDFNADGRPDLVVAEFDSSRVSVLVNDGTGLFAGGRVYGVGYAPASVTAGDFSGDGRPDLWVTEHRGYPDHQGAVAELVNNGNGTFGGMSVTNVAGKGIPPPFVTAGDLNGDGRPDLAVASNDDHLVIVMLFNADGTYASMHNCVTGNQPGFIAIGDLNADGKADLVVANGGSGTVSVLMGRGGGDFEAKVDYGTGGSPTSVAIGDFDADGWPDLAVANGAGVSVLRGNGDGTFAAKADYPTGGLSGSVATGDFNRDGRPDLAVANRNTNTVSVLLGNGDGTFAAHAEYATGASPQSVGVGDFDGDGKPDLALASSSANTASVLLGLGDGTFAAKRDYGPFDQPVAIAVADFNADGRSDLAAVSAGSNSVSVLLSVGSSSAPLLLPPVLVSPPTGGSVQPAALTLRWRRSIGAATYRLQLARDAAFQSLVRGTVALADTFFTVDSLNQGTGYYWRVRAVSAADSSAWSGVWSFVTAIPPRPPAPVLASPPAGAAGQPTALTLRWHVRAGSTAYRLQLAPDAAFQDLVCATGALSDTFLAVAGLRRGIDYYWRVRALSATDSSDWSETWDFTTREIPAPLLIEPADGAGGLPTSLVFTWHSSPTATRYGLQFAGSSDFAHPYTDFPFIPDTSQSVSDLTPGTRYYWRAVALDGPDASAWSTVWSFTTAGLRRYVVYPGDANADSIVDARDVLPLGTYYGLTGPVRPNASLNWSAQELDQQWTPAAACRADCNGDGRVDSLDVQAIIANWHFRCSGLMPPQPSPEAICQELLQAIDAQPPGPGPRAVRAAVLDYMRSTLHLDLSFRVVSCAPRPSDGPVTVQFMLPESVPQAWLRVFDAQGRLVREEPLHNLQPGPNRTSWTGQTADGRSAPAGVYLYELSAGAHRATGRMVMLTQGRSGR